MDLSHLFNICAAPHASVKQQTKISQSGASTERRAVTRIDLRHLQTGAASSGTDTPKAPTPSANEQKKEPSAVVHVSTVSEVTCCECGFAICLQCKVTGHACARHAPGKQHSQVIPGSTCAECFSTTCRWCQCPCQKLWPQSPGSEHDCPALHSSLTPLEGDLFIGGPSIPHL